MWGWTGCCICWDGTHDFIFSEVISQTLREVGNGGCAGEESGGKDAPRTEAAGETEWAQRDAEIVAVLNKAAESEKQVGLGTQIEEWKKKYLGGDSDFTFEVIREKTPARYVDFSGPEYDRPESE